MQAAAQVAVARQQVKRNEDFLALAKARHRVGQATLLDVRQAEVTKGTSDVALLRAVQAENEAKLDLLRRMGIEPPVSIERIVLTDSFPVTAPDFQLDSLLALSDSQNPVLRSLRAREHAARLGVPGRLRPTSFPTLSVAGGVERLHSAIHRRGSAAGADAQPTPRRKRADCLYNNSVRTGLSLGGRDPQLLRRSGPGGRWRCVARAGRSSRSSLGTTCFPSRTPGQPFGANLTISLPIFTGFSRSLRLSQARAQEDDAEEEVRARRLQVRTDVHSRYLGLQTAYQAIGFRAPAGRRREDQLRLAQDRYRLGAGTALEVSDAQNAVQQAEGDYVNAVYAYHKAIAALEAAVGRSLR